MDTAEKRFEKLKSEYQNEEDQVRIAGWEKSFRVHALTSKLKENDAFKLLMARYEKERMKLRKALLEDSTLFKDQEGQMLGRLIHARIGFIDEFFKIFSVAERQAAGVLETVEKALAKDE